MKVAVIIPWRDSGDIDRRANFEHVERYYRDLDIGPVVVASDGETHGRPFNRSRAYNTGWSAVEASDVLVWNEADTLIPRGQLEEAVRVAAAAPGIVIPFTERHELSEPVTLRVLTGEVDPFAVSGEVVYPDGSSIGQCGVTSAETMRAVGRWDEGFAGWGYDDNAMLLLFESLVAPRRYVHGKGVHLWHPLAYGNVSDEARFQTQRNAARYAQMKKHADDGDLDALRGMIL